MPVDYTLDELISNFKEDLKEQLPLAAKAYQDIKTKHPEGGNYETWARELLQHPSYAGKIRLTSSILPPGDIPPGLASERLGLQLTQAPTVPNPPLPSALVRPDT